MQMFSLSMIQTTQKAKQFIIIVQLLHHAVVGPDDREYKEAFRVHREMGKKVIGDS